MVTPQTLNMVTIESLIILASASLISFCLGLLVNWSRVAKARRKMVTAEQYMIDAHAELLDTQKALLLAQRAAAEETAAPAAAEALCEPASPAAVLPMRTPGASAKASVR